MGSTIKDVMWWGLGVFSYFLKISSVSIFLCLGLGFLWVYCDAAVYSIIWNKFGVRYVFCTDIETWVLWVERNFLLQRYAFGCKAKRGRRSVHWIMGRCLRLHGMCRHQGCSVVSLNHRQLLCFSGKSGFGAVEKGAYTVTLWLKRWLYKEGLRCFKFMTTTCLSRFFLNGSRRGPSTWCIIMLGRRLIGIFSPLFKHEVAILSIQREVKMRTRVIGFSFDRSTKEQIFLLDGINGIIVYDCMVIRFDRHALILGHTIMMVMEILEGIIWVISKVLWRVRFQGIFKPTSRSSREPIHSLYNEST